MDGSLLDGRYRLTARLAGGGMGEVWRAVDERIGRDVAVKIVTAARLTPDALARFDREARIAGNLSGPNIVTVHDYGQSVIGGQTVPYLVMELVSGRTLGQIVDSADRLPPLTRSLRWAMQVCDALEIAHRAGVVHRDIKPGNVMVTDEGPVKVLDFGIARFVEDEQLRSGLTATGMIIGSAEYLSPEQADGRKADYRSDLYSLGVLLYFLATGRPPFQADSFMALAYQHSTKQPEPPSTHRLGLPPEFDALVLELLAKDPAARPESAAAVRKRLSSLLRQERERAPRAGGGAAGGGSGGAGTGADGSAGGAAAGVGAASASGSAGAAAGIGAVSTPSAAAAASATPNPDPSLSDTPAQAVAPPDTGLWSAPQATELRHYPGDPGPVIPIGRPQPPTKIDGRPTRRAFVGADTVIGLGAAGGAGWWMLSNSKKADTTSNSGTNSPTSTHTPGVATPTQAGTTPASSTSSASVPQNPTFAATLTGHNANVVSVAFTPDSKVLASTSFDRSARLWDVADPANAAPLGTCNGHTGGLWGIAMSPDGHTLATASDDKSVRLWNIQDPKNPAPLSRIGLPGRGIGVAFSPDGKFLAAGDDANNVTLWSLSDRADPTAVATLTGHTGSVYSVAFAPSAKILASGSFDRTARLWDYSDPSKPLPVTTLTGHSGRVFNVAFRRPDGTVLAVSSSDTTFQLWDVSTPAAPKLLSTPKEPDETTGIAFSPDGRTLATGCGASTQVRLWNVADPAVPSPLDPLSGHTKYTYGVAFSPDGKLLASASEDKTVRLWRF